MALPNTNLSVAMVKAELGAATNDVGRLCIHPNINKWSKYKPVRFATNNEVTDAQRKSVAFGLQHSNDITDIQSLKSQSFNYLKTRGGVNEPFRISDFAGYNKDATSPMKSHPIVTFYPDYQNLLDIKINIDTDADIQVKDMGYYDSWYYAVLFFKNDVFLGYKTDETTIGLVNRPSIRFFADFPTDATHYYVCAANDISDGFSTIMSENWFIPLPFDSYIYSGNEIVSSNSFPGSVYIIGLNDTLSSDYTPILNISSSNPFLIDSSGTVNLIVKIIPTVTINMQLPFFVSARPTFADGGSVPYNSGVLPAQVYEILPNGSVEILFDRTFSTEKTLLIHVQNFMRHYNGNDYGTMIPQLSNVNYRLSYNNNQLADNRLYTQYL